jgi:hypothetical protein
VIQSADTSIILITADVVGLDQAFADVIRKNVSSVTGIQAGAILLNSSHTHAALWPRSDGKLHGEFPGLTPAEQAYFVRLPFDYATAALLAMNALQPARVSGGTGRTQGLAVNRRERMADGRTILGWNRDAFVDEEVPTIRIDALTGGSIATIVSFGCHPVCLGGEIEQSSTDFIGPLRRQVESIRGGLCLFVQGAAGNVLPLEAFCDFLGPEQVMGARLGLEAAHCIADADPVSCVITRTEYGSVTPIGLYRRVPVVPQPTQVLAWRRAVLNLPLLPAPSGDAMALELEQRRADYETKRREGAGRAVLNPIGYHIAWLESMLQRLADGPLPESLTGEVWAARVGDVGIVGTPAEVFTEIGYGVRRQSPFPTTIFGGYCQALLGYVATEAEYAHGGYEPTVAQRGYGHPAPFSPTVASILTEQCLRLLRELAALAPISQPLDSSCDSSSPECVG